MTDPNATGSMMPTGEEAPRGYELFNEKKPDPTEIVINSVFVSQLADIELAELEQLRKLAMHGIVEIIGAAHEDISFEKELSVLPGTDDSDWVIFRAYRNNRLLGYALMVIGWPEKGEWVIQHMIINPDNRNQGIGTKIVNKIEDYARNSQPAESACLSAIPIEEAGRKFWELREYTEAPGSHQLTIAGNIRDITVLKKKL